MRGLSEAISAVPKLTSLSRALASAGRPDEHLADLVRGEGRVRDDDIFGKHGDPYGCLTEAPPALPSTFRNVVMIGYCSSRRDRAQIFSRDECPQVSANRPRSAPNLEPTQVLEPTRSSLRGNRSLRIRYLSKCGQSLRRGLNAIGRRDDLEDMLFRAYGWNRSAVRSGHAPDPGHPRLQALCQAFG